MIILFYILYMSILNVFDLILTFFVLDQYYKWVESVIWVGVDV